MLGLPSEVEQFEVVNLRGVGVAPGPRPLGGGRKPSLGDFGARRGPQRAPEPQWGPDVPHDDSIVVLRTRFALCYVGELG